MQPFANSAKRWVWGPDRALPLSRADDPRFCWEGFIHPTWWLPWSSCSQPYPAQPSVKNPSQCLWLWWKAPSFRNQNPRKTETASVLILHAHLCQSCPAHSRDRGFISRPSNPARTYTRLSWWHLPAWPRSSNAKHHLGVVPMASSAAGLSFPYHKSGFCKEQN